MAVVLLSIALVALIMLAMAIGLFFRRPCLRGSCGGPEVLGPDGESLSCAACPRRKLREGLEAMAAEGQEAPAGQAPSRAA